VNSSNQQQEENKEQADVSIIHTKYMAIFAGYLTTMP
jgi:hypothetical protein